MSQFLFGIRYSSRAFFLVVLITVCFPAQTIFAQSSVSGQSGTSEALGFAGMGLNAGVAVMMAHECAAPKGPPIDCVLAAESAMQAVSMAQGAVSAGGSQGATASNFNPDFGSGLGSNLDNSNLPNISGPNTGSLTSGQENSLLKTDPGLSQPLANLNQANDLLKKAGVSISPDGSSITLPNGTSVPSNASLSSGSPATAGMTPQQIASVKKKLAEIEGKLAQKYHVDPVGVKSAGGAKLAGTGADSGGGTNLNFPSLQLGGLKMNRGPASVNTSGLSRNYHGDEIGVQQESIFQMISRRYQIEKANHEFLDN